MINSRISAMQSRYTLLIGMVLLPFLLNAQIGGESTYEFLNLTNSARMTALGGNQVAIHDSTDLNTAYHNPSLLNEGMKNFLAVNYISYIAGIHYGYASYSFQPGLPGNFAVGMHYINYGDFTAAEPDGQRTGTFTAGEYALNLIWSNKYKRLSYGVNLKPVFSSFEAYRSFGLAADLGASIQSQNGLTTYGFVIKNIGSQITTYYENGEREKLPLDIQFGLSQRLAHAPVRLSGTLQHLQQWKLGSIEKTNNQTGERYQDDNAMQQFLRHLVLGVELLPSANFTVRAGYNYQRRQDMKLDERISTVGLSWGFGFKVSRFHLNYGSARYHLAAANNVFSIAINLSDNYKNYSRSYSE